MIALILASTSPEATRDLARPLAGAPLLVRQLEWLRGAGFDTVVINRIASDRLPAEIWTEPLQATGVQVVLIPTMQPLSPRELALRAGMSHEPMVVVPHAVLGNLDLSEVVLRLKQCGGMAEVSAETGAVVLRDEQGAGATHRIYPKGWLRRLDSELAVHQLTERILSHQVEGIEVRGTEVRPGLWVARGARISDRARYTGPVYLGADCVVQANAEVGPGAVVGTASVVESGASVKHARVDSGVVVGRDVRVEHAWVGRGTIEPHQGQQVDIEDPLVIEALESNGAWLPRVAALGPLALAMAAAPRDSQLVSRLRRIVWGSGHWLGVRDDDPDAVLYDILPLLVPNPKDAQVRRAASAYYSSHKSVSTDLHLLWRALRVKIRRGEVCA